MGMASFPSGWRCVACRTYIYVNAETGHNYRVVNGLCQIWCSCCKSWGEPVSPNG